MMSTASRDHRQSLRWQFSLRKLLAVVTWTALFFALWRIPGEGASLSAAFLCATMAASGFHLTRSKLVFVAGISGFLLIPHPSHEEPFFASALMSLWLMFAVWFARKGFKAVFFSPPQEL